MSAPKVPVKLKKDTCPQGHPFDGERIYRDKVWRTCSTCRNATQRAWQARRQLRHG